MNRKGDKVLSVYWFVILVLVAGGVFAMVYTFYQHPYDIREIEANLMINKVADCISTGGEINSYVFDSDFTSKFMSTCRLTFEGSEVQEYYLEADILKEGSMVVGISEGDTNLLADCEIEKKHERISKCVKRGFYTVGGGELYFVEILSVIRKIEKNVR